MKVKTKKYREPKYNVIRKFEGAIVHSQENIIRQTYLVGS